MSSNAEQVTHTNHHNSNQTNDVESPTTAVLFCPACGYDTRATIKEQCPECGQSIDFQTIEKWQIPWQRAKGLGHIPAFFQTVWRVTLCKKQTARSVALPVDLQKAQWFRRIVCVLLWLLGSYLVIFSSRETQTPISWLNTHTFFTTTAISLSIFIFIQILTGLHFYWFTPKHLTLNQQKSTLAISHYACAPLAWILVTPMLLMAAEIIKKYRPEIYHEKIEITAFLTVTLITLAAPISQLRTITHFVSHSAQHKNHIRILLFLGLPIQWLFSALLSLWALPSLLYFTYKLITLF